MASETAEVMSPSPSPTIGICLLALEIAGSLERFYRTQCGDVVPADYGFDPVAISGDEGGGPFPRGLAVRFGSESLGLDADGAERLYAVFGQKCGIGAAAVPVQRHELKSSRPCSCRPTVRLPKGRQHLP